MDELLPTKNYLLDIYKEISTMGTDVSLLRQDQENFKEDLKKVGSTLDHVKLKIDGYDKRFDAMDNIAKYKGSWLKGFERNWWKILLFVVPIIAGLFEFALWLKNMPVT